MKQVQLAYSTVDMSLYSGVYTLPFLNSSCNWCCEQYKKSGISTDLDKLNHFRRDPPNQPIYLNIPKLPLSGLFKATSHYVSVKT